MRGLITIGLCTLAVAAGCNQKSDKGKKGNGDASVPYQTTPSTTSPSATTPSNTTLNGRNCTTEELFGKESRRIIITAQPGVHQPAQMQIINSDGSSHLYNLQPTNKFWFMPGSDNYDAIPSSGSYSQGSNYYNNQNQNNTSSSGNIFGGLFGGGNNGSTGGGDAGHVTVAPSGNVYLRGVEYSDSSSGTVKAEKITAKAECI